MADFDNGKLYIGDYEVSLEGLKELLDIISSMTETEIVDVDVDEDDVICTFADGEVQVAHCHPEDEDVWSLETGISICLGKYLAGGSNAYNRLIHQGVKIYQDKVRKAIDEYIAKKEEERIRENKRQKHERHLKRRAERRVAEENSKCDVNKDDKYEVELPMFLQLLSNVLDDLGISVEIEKG